MKFNNNWRTQKFKLTAIIHKIWRNRRLYFISVGIGALLGMTITLLMPKEYMTKIILASENKKNKSSSSLIQFISHIGLSADFLSAKSALVPQMYSEIIKSDKFIIELLNTKLPEAVDKSGNFQKFNRLYDILNHNSDASKIPLSTDSIVCFNYRESDYKLIQKLKNKIRVWIDEKNETIELDVFFDNPVIAYALANTVVSKLENFVIDYRNEKDSICTISQKEIYEGSKSRYYQLVADLGILFDTNRNLSKKIGQVDMEILEKDIQIAFLQYKSSYNLWQLERAKQLEQKTVFVILNNTGIAANQTFTQKRVIIYYFILFSVLIPTFKLFLCIRR